MLRFGGQRREWKVATCRVESTVKVQIKPEKSVELGHFEIVGWRQRVCDVSKCAHSAVKLQI
jgi:hypothetical protein